MADFWIMTSQCHIHDQTLSQSLAQPLHRHLPAVRSVQRDCDWGLKNGGNSHWSWEPIMQSGNPNLYLDQPIKKAQCQPIGGHVSYLPDSPIATRLGLCSSLICNGGAQWRSSQPIICCNACQHSCWLSCRRLAMEVMVVLLINFIGKNLKKKYTQSKAFH